MKRLILFAFVLTTLIGCTPKIQVVTLRGSNVRPASDGLILDNDTLTLRYDFASERGQMHITVYNKLNHPLYIDWKRSSFIIGQDKVDYWQDIADVNLAGATYGNRYLFYSVSYITGTIAKEDMVGFIPPQTRIEKRQFVIVPQGNIPLRGAFTTEKEPSKMTDRRKTVDVVVYEYASAESPLKFRNYLTFSTDKDFKNEFHIDTNFWASGVKVLPRDQILSYFNGTYLEPIAFKKPDSFYVPLPIE